MRYHADKLISKLAKMGMSTNFNDVFPRYFAQLQSLDKFIPFAHDMIIINFNREKLIFYMMTFFSVGLQGCQQEITLQFSDQYGDAF